MNNPINRLNNLVKIWARDCLKQRDFFRDDLKYYFKFMNKENTSKDRNS